MRVVLLLTRTGHQPAQTAARPQSAARQSRTLEKEGLGSAVFDVALPLFTSFCSYAFLMCFLPPILLVYALQQRLAELEEETLRLRQLLEQSSQANMRLTMTLIQQQHQHAEDAKSAPPPTVATDSATTVTTTPTTAAATTAAARISVAIQTEATPSVVSGSADCNADASSVMAAVADMGSSHSLALAAAAAWAAQVQQFAAHASAVSASVSNSTVPNVAAPISPFQNTGPVPFQHQLPVSTVPVFDLAHLFASADESEREQQSQQPPVAIWQESEQDQQPAPPLSHYALATAVCLRSCRRLRSAAISLICLLPLAIASGQQ